MSHKNSNNLNLYRKLTCKIKRVSFSSNFFKKFILHCEHSSFIFPHFLPSHETLSFKVLLTILFLLLGNKKRKISESAISIVKQSCIYMNESIGFFSLSSFFIYFIILCNYKTHCRQKKINFTILYPFCWQ